MKILKSKLLVENCMRTENESKNISFPSPNIARPNLSIFWSLVFSYYFCIEIYCFKEICS